MEFFLAACGVVVCVALMLRGLTWPVLIGGALGSFVGVAGFGGAISGAVPGAIIGAVLVVALRK